MTVNAPQNDHDEANPTAKDPWTATLCWARGQNASTVSVFPNRTPVWSVLGSLRAGESFASVAAEYDVPIEAVHVVWQLRLDILNYEFSDVDGTDES